MRLPAFPMPIAVSAAGDTISTGENLHPDWIGLSKREYFAAAAMQGLLAALNRVPDKYHAREIATAAVLAADALAAALSEELP